MKIIAKSFPNQAQIQGRIDSKAFDGIELFIMDDVVENPAKYKEIIKFARDNFSVVNFETFYAVNADGRKRTGGLIMPETAVRERSRALLEATIALNEGKGNVNTHFVGKPSPLVAGDCNFNMASADEQISQIGEYLAPFKDVVSLENVITFEMSPAGQGEGALLFNVGCDIPDFVTMHEKYGVPMNLDTAHVAICMEHYRRQAERGHLLLGGQETPIGLTDYQKRMGERLRKEVKTTENMEQIYSHYVTKPSAIPFEITNAFLEEIAKLPAGAIKNVHFINSKVNDKDEYSDGYVEYSAGTGRLLDLDRVLPYLLDREQKTGKPATLVTEVVDGLYTTPENPADYNGVPYMVKMADETRRKMVAIDEMTR